MECGIWKRANSYLLVERIQPSEENKKPPPLLPWEQLSNAMDALQEVALEQSWGEGFLSKERKPVCEKAILLALVIPAGAESGSPASGPRASFFLALPRF